MKFQNVNDKRYIGVFFAFALIEVLLCSGITYGWASIVYVFKVEYFYMDLCKESTNLTTSTNATLPFNNVSIVDKGTGPKVIGEDGLPGCLAQDSIFNLIFTVAVVFFTSVQFPTGLFIDKFGPRTARLVGGSMYVLACVGLGFVSIGYEYLLFPIFTIICIGGGVLAMSVYQASNIIFRQNRSKVICILHGAFDSSAVMLLVFKLIYDSGIEYRYIMFGYAAICLVLNAVGTFVLIPTQKTLLEWVEDEKEMYENYGDDGPEFMHKSLDASYNTTNINSIKVYKPKNETQSELKKRNVSRPEDYSEFNSEKGQLDKEDLEDNGTDDELPLVETGKKESNEHEESVMKSILSPLYLFELLYLITYQLKLWYFVGALADDMIRLTHNDKNSVSKYIDIFGYVQFGGIFITPIIGFVFDKDKGKENQALIDTPEKAHLQQLRKCILPFALTSVLCIAFSIVSAVQNLELQVLSFILYMIVRGFLYSNHGAYIGAAFPASQFGTLYGFGIFIAGVVGTLQYALFQFKSGPLGGDPFWVNVILLILVIVGSMHPVYLWWHCRREATKN